MEETPIEPPQTPIKTSKKSFKLGSISLVVILLAISFLVGYTLAMLQLPQIKEVVPAVTLETFRGSSEEEAKARDIDFALFWEVWDKLYAEHINRSTIKEEDLFFGAIRGMVQAVGDPHTAFFDPAAYKSFTDELSGSFQGIGAEISIENGRLTVVAPLQGSPAEKAGIRPGDFIVAIDDEETYNMLLDQAVSLIRGPKGTDVTLKVIHQENGGQVEEITITRAEIDVPVVTWSVGEDKIAYINILSFNAGSEKKFLEALNDIQRQDVVGVIVDVRSNPGGYLTESVNIASAWVEENDVVVREVFTDASKNTDYRAKSQIKVPNVPTIVLINGGSASASEILAGALQDYELATIVGEQSFGKGSVQNFEQLSDGTGIKISVAKWLTPKGRSIEEEGITPDIEVERSYEDYSNGVDPQLDKAKELILGEF